MKLEQQSVLNVRKGLKLMLIKLNVVSLSAQLKWSKKQVLGFLVGENIPKEQREDNGLYDYKQIFCLSFNATFHQFKFQSAV